MKDTAIVAFAGFGLVDLALREAGFRVIGIEYDDQIAAVNRANGGECMTADVCEVDPRQFLPLAPQLFHASPPCQNHSQAKAGGAETEQDIALARAVCRFIRTLKPRFVTLENVWLYRQSESWKMIRRCLIRTGYKVDFWRLCSADYGTPQARHRMIVLARRDGIKPHKPFPTHSKTPDFFSKRWVGWYEVIEDLVPGLPESQFAPWQLERLPGNLVTMLAPVNGQYSEAIEAALPAQSICSGHRSNKYRAVIVDDRLSNGGTKTMQRETDEPVFSVTTRHVGKIRAFIADGKLNNHAAKLTTRDGESPAFTVTTSHNNRDVKAFVVSQDYGNSNSAPARVLSRRSGQEPIHTIKANGARGEFKAVVDGRVVSLTPRCLARFQDMPDWYELPPSNELACKGIGNGVPLRLYRAALEALGVVK